jgi:DNA mismatch repair protein MutS2
MISKGSLELDSTLTDIMAEKQKMIATRELLEYETNEMKARNADLEIMLTRLNLEEQHAIQETRDRIVREASELHRQIHQASSELRKKKKKETVNMARKVLTELQAKLNSEIWAPITPGTKAEHSISVGDVVYLKENGLQATVLSISGETREAEVKAGQINLKVGINSIEKAPSEIVEKSEIPNKISVPGVRAISTELDLRGRRADEVEVVLDSYLNDATLANLSDVLIIHGIGTGTVRQIVRDFLNTHPLVKSFRIGKQEEGGDGVTVVNL